MDRRAELLLERGSSYLAVWRDSWTKLDTLITLIIHKWPTAADRRRASLIWILALIELPLGLCQKTPIKRAIFADMPDNQPSPEVPSAAHFWPRSSRDGSVNQNSAQNGGAEPLTKYFII
jgi:hypothetical protein